MPDTIQQRDKIEFIIDSCSMGHKVYRSLSSYVNHIVQKQPRIYEDYRFVIPLQIGIETKRRLFTEFLKKELSEPDNDGYLERFYQHHREDVKVVDTRSSHIYKFMFGLKAITMVGNDVKRIERVASEAAILHSTYTNNRPGLDTEHFIKAYKEFRSEIKSEYQHHKKEFASKERLIKNFNTRILSIDNPKLIGQISRTAQETSIARLSEKFFKKSPEEYKYILQAMYSRPEIFRSLKDDDDFRHYRADKGERAIEEFLYSKRSERDPKRVTVVVSEDINARKNIQELRKKSTNTIIVLSKYGFALGMKELGIIKDMSDILDSSYSAAISSRRKKYTGRSDENIIDPEIEEKFAGRFVELDEKGYWHQHEKGAEKKRISSGWSR